ncbi:nucleotide exchange factor GrpE [Kordiimonas marina]|uniref:nucleotide exchange factor GrpE n=1 Tax=Kordiimonas marina TaxID=2872312 RepID=UPI001FF1D082|nr:nucleotide exchange factor GrpE [Kordiimonas marina]MCJ9429890.1 nucleotide exchange factor GrpE [Kordiimonas marina]
MSEDQKNEMAEDAAEEMAAEEMQAEAQDGDDLVAQLQAENADLKDKLLRAVAETENVRRRADKDKQDASAYAVTGFARDMLNVSDNLRRALDTLPEEIEGTLKSFVEGVTMTERELLNTLERHGIREVKPEAGDKFDPLLHQAMFEVPTDEVAPGSVVQVVTAGYVIKDRLLRPAMVGVAKGAAQKVDTEA